LGYNYRLPDVQCALGISQLKRLDSWIAARQAHAAYYDEAFAGMAHVRPLANRRDRTNVYHLYVIQLDLGRLKIDRATAFNHLRQSGIGANVHYRPVYLHSYYREKFGYGRGLCPVAEAVYERILTLPMFPQMTLTEADRVIVAVGELA